MSTPTKQADTRSQLRNLMNQHTAATYSKPVAAAPAPVAATPSPQPTRASSSRSAPAALRFTVRITPAENEKLNAIMLETHQRLGKPINISEVFRIGFARLGANAPITAEEFTQLRSQDLRRVGGAG